MASSRPRRLGPRVAAALVALAVLASVAACSSGGDGGPTTEGITVFSELRGQQGAAFEAVLAQFTEDTGIPVRSTSSSNFEIDLVDRIQNDDAPDVALVPQPGLISGLVAETGAPVPLPDRVLSVVEANFRPDWAGLLTFPDPTTYDAETQSPSEGEARQYGLFAQASAKSLVWYSPSQFAQRGLEVPTTMDELAALVIDTSDEDVQAWCVGLRDGYSSGWVGTDWIEDFVLRYEGAEVYDGWVDGSVPFTDERIASMFADAGLAGLTNPTSSGPLRLIESTPVDVAIDGLLGQQPECLMHRQASFAAAWLPTGTTLGPDGDLDVFVLPSVDGGAPPMLLGAQVAVAFTDSDEVWQLMEYLADRDGAASVWAQYPGYLAPQAGFSLDRYGDAFDREVAELAQSSSMLCFDASDLMPPRVGVRTFWTEIMNWVDGKPLPVVLFEIQQAWSASEDLQAFDSGGDLAEVEAADGPTEVALPLEEGIDRSSCAVLSDDPSSGDDGGDADDGGETDGGGGGTTPPSTTSAGDG